MPRTNETRRAVGGRASGSVFAWGLNASRDSSPTKNIKGGAR